MKFHGSLFLCTCALGLGLIAGIRAQNPSYSIGPQTFSGGGGTSRGGNYAVSGSIGLADAGPVLSGGAYLVRGGFWSVEMVLAGTGEVPSMLIEHSNDGQVVIRWPSQGGPWVLQQTDALPGGWTSAGEPVSGNGGEEFVVVRPSSAERFFRLTKP